ncbi:13072_t:CDS:1, partial [Funneliformis geosporum]
ADKSIKESYQKLKLRKRVAEVLGILEGTIRSVVADWNSCGDSSFTLHKVLGRPILKSNENISKLLYTKILKLIKQ